jgi:uncharacterized membrane protein
VNAIRRYWRFSVFMAVLVAATTLARLGIPGERFAHSLMIGFDVAAVVFLLLVVRLFQACNVAEMRRRSAENEPDHILQLVIGSVVTFVIFVSVFSELSDSRVMSVILSVVTVLVAWVFGNVMFTMHYAHCYFATKGGKDSKGLEFPGSDPHPDYWDFAYFAFVLGMTFQVSDVVITDRGIRRLALLHGLLGFIFNIGVIAISVGIIGNLFQPK